MTAALERPPRFPRWLRRTLFPKSPRQKSLQAIGSFAGRYSTAAALSAFVFAGGVSSRRHRVLLNQILGHFGLNAERPPVELPEIRIQELLDGPVPVVLQEPAGRDGNVSLLELLVLAQLVALKQPRSVFEIGTFDGRTTLNLAANTEGRVFTLDLPAAQAASTALPLDPGDQAYIEKPQSGALFAGKPEQQRIVQLFGDSASFDFSQWEDSVDFIFIDGAHSREYVLSDTEHALRMLRPDGGVILWHDYDACFNGVTEALNEIARRGFGLKRVEGTTLAILMAGDRKPVR